jgi:ABC-type uncharacterized transport system substrate-binding protein
VPIIRRLAAAVLGTTALASTPAVLHAHPHILADVRVELRFDAEGRIAAVNSAWIFDPAFSAFAVTGLDANLNGRLEPVELRQLAQLHVESLADHGFLTHLVVDGVAQGFLPPADYALVHDGLHLTLRFELPLTRPVAIRAGAFFQVFDPDYFVGFSFGAADGLALRAGPPGCTVTHHPARGVDGVTMAAILALPASQRALPPDLATFAANLADSLTIACPARVVPPAAPLAGERPATARTIFDMRSEPRP